MTGHADIIHIVRLQLGKRDAGFAEEKLLNRVTSFLIMSEYADGRRAASFVMLRSEETVQCRSLYKSLQYTPLSIRERIACTTRGRSSW